MRKYPLIGVSIIAVVLLVLSSLTNVVGYQSLNSSGVNDSPLFRERTQKATQNQQSSIVSNYLGKGKNLDLLILPRLNQTDSLREVISKIQAMDENAFHRFVGYVVNQIGKKDKLREINIRGLINELRKLRESKNNIIIYRNTNDDSYTMLHNYFPTACWFPGCYLFEFIIFVILFMDYHFNPTSFLRCGVP